MNAAHTGRRVEAIVIGGSAGSVDVLIGILPALPAGFAIPIALVIHIPPMHPSRLAEVLQSRSVLTVKEVEDKEPIAPATVYVAPPNYHLLIERELRFALSVDAAVHYARPAIDVLFESAADAYGPALLGLLLTGANEDGARGLAAIKSAGGITAVQSPESAAVPVMPEAALRISAIDHVLPQEAAPFLARFGEPAKKTRRRA